MATSTSTTTAVTGDIELESTSNSHGWTTLPPAAATVSVLGRDRTHFPYPPSGQNTIDNDGELPPRNAVDVVPNGGYGWTIVATCSLINFWTNGWITAWGVLQAAIISASSSSLHTAPVSTSTITFVGSLALSLLVAFGLFSIRLIRMLGSRAASCAGVILVGLGIMLASLTIENIGGLFCTAGAMVGIGGSILYTAANSLPVQYFSSKLGTANGLIKMGGGIGATVIAVSAQGLIDKVGISWTFRVFGFLMLATALPCALLMKERTPPGNTPFVDWAMLRNVPFLCTCLSGMVCTFVLFVPPFFIPLFAQSIGLSASTGAALVAGFGVSTTFGRFLSGVACDKIGSLNTLVITLGLNSISMLAIWPFSTTLSLLVIFAALNGMANGAFFVALPTAVAGESRIGFDMLC